MSNGRTRSHDVAAHAALDDDLAIPPIASAGECDSNFLETLDDVLDASESSATSSSARVKAFPPAAARLFASVPEVQEPPELQANLLTSVRGWWGKGSKGSPRLIVVLLAGLVIAEASVIALLWHQAPTVDVQGAESMSVNNGAVESPTQSIAAPTTKLRVESAPNEPAVVLDSESVGRRRSSRTLPQTSRAPEKVPQSVVVPGWLSVASGAPLQILEGDQVIGSTEISRLMIPAGRHKLDLVNESLGFRISRDVFVAPGKVASLKVDLPNGVVHINASPWAEVWLDGQRLGETPLGNIDVPIGPHEVIFRHPEFGERRGKVMVTLNGISKVAVDMRK
jgi:hypothetical protein